MDKCGIVSDTISINMEGCNCKVYIPNSDNKNDHFSPIFDCDFTEYSFSIFNRWVELIFKTNNQGNSWNGNYKGELCQTGVYICILEYKYNEVFKRIYGNVNLLK